jgi:hypothetical protein
VGKALFENTFWLIALPSTGALYRLKDLRRLKVSGVLCFCIFFSCFVGKSVDVVALIPLLVNCLLFISCWWQPILYGLIFLSFYGYGSGSATNKMNACVSRVWLWS